MLELDLYGGSFTLPFMLYLHILLLPVQTPRSKRI